MLRILTRQTCMQGRPYLEDRRRSDRNCSSQARNGVRAQLGNAGLLYVNMLQTRLRFIFGFILAPRMVGNKATGLALPSSALGKKQWNPVASGEATETYFVAKGFYTIVETTKHPEHGAIGLPTRAIIREASSPLAGEQKSPMPGLA